MNEHQFCFIICTNNKEFTQECLLYISNLIIPDGYSIDVLTIDDSKSMASGYNEAMKASDAKYKIYMHQDVFILNKYFLINILNIFKSNEKIGMLGLVGAVKLNKAAIMWGSDRVGCTMIRSESDKPYISEQYNPASPPHIVSAIDGFLMVTGVDIPWREDLFDGWDFYDMSQSIEFKRHGYLIVVPEQTTPWCLHDDGYILSLLNFNHYRKVFLEEYKNELS